METRRATRSGPHAANGLVIWRARRRGGATQEVLARESGISRIQIIKLENGMHLPRPDTRDRMEAFLGLKPGTIKCEEAAPVVAPFRDGSGVGSVRGGAKRGAAGAGKARGVKAA
jgi:transcriptional regulator with XRE-family HTH domain